MVKTDGAQGRTSALTAAISRKPKPVPRREEVQRREQHGRHAGEQGFARRRPEAGAALSLERGGQDEQQALARSGKSAARSRSQTPSTTAACGGIIFAPSGKRKSPMKFALGQSIQRLEDDALLRGAGRYTDDFALARAAHVFFVRSPHAHARITGVSMSGRSHAAWRARRAHRQGRGGRRARQHSVPYPGARPEGDAAADPRARHGAARRRSGGDGHRRDAAAGEGRGREGRGRLRAAARGDRCARRRSRVRGRAGREQGQGRRGARQGGARHAPRARQQPPGGEPDRAARRARRVRRGERPHHALHAEPGPASPLRPDRRRGAQDAGASSCAWSRATSAARSA